VYRVGKILNKTKMKKLLMFFTCILIKSTIATFAQWAGTNPITTNSLVGIGTQSPATPLDVNGAVHLSNIRFLNSGGINFIQSGSTRSVGSWAPLYFGPYGTITGIKMMIDANGNVGVGTTSPGARLHIEAPNGSLGLYINQQATADNTFGMKINVNRDLTKAFVLSNSSSGKDVVLIYGSGQIIANGFSTNTGGGFSANGIGQYAYGFTVSATADYAKAYSLTDKNNKEVFYVWGNGVVNAKKIYAEAFAVCPDAMSINWYDNVFSSSYKLKSLNDVEQFIKENNHLPDIPSEKNVKANGFNIAEMDGLLLKKIEELTLYIIQQQKEIEDLKQKVNNNN
jgi:hypothetical protein